MIQCVKALRDAGSLEPEFLVQIDAIAVDKEGFSNADLCMVNENWGDFVAKIMQMLAKTNLADIWKQVLCDLQSKVDALSSNVKELEKEINESSHVQTGCVLCDIEQPALVLVCTAFKIDIRMQWLFCRSSVREAELQERINTLEAEFAKKNAQIIQMEQVCCDLVLQCYLLLLKHSSCKEWLVRDVVLPST